MTPSPIRVADAFLTQEGSASIPWLKKLEAFLQQENEAETYWIHSWDQAIVEVRRIIRQGDARHPPISSARDLYDHLMARGLLEPEQIAILESRGPVPPRIPRKAPPLDPMVLIEQLRDTLPVPLFLSYAHHLGPQHVAELSSWIDAFRTLRGKHPFPWKLLARIVPRVEIDAKPDRSATASFSRWLTLYLRGGRASGGHEALIHEIGHAFEGAQLDSRDIAGWRSLYGNPPFSHTYMPERAVEDFAEVFRQYHTEKAILRAKAPDKYADMAQRVQGWG